jgi:hypothetical protein
MPTSFRLFIGMRQRVVRGGYRVYRNVVRRALLSSF